MHTTTATAPEYLIRVPSPIGRLEILSDGEAITGLSIERAGTLPWEHEPERTNEVLERAAQQLREYFAGQRVDFDLPLRAVGTPFQQAVWAGIADLAFGQVASYGSWGS
jgi:methylated-DNA-[protein]-cysteine S-methyltransferase